MAATTVDTTVARKVALTAVSRAELWVDAMAAPWAG
jgi:hypothetical protein